jgi:chromosome segregation ATPase
VHADQSKLRAIRSLSRGAIRHENACNSRYLNALHFDAAVLGAENSAKADRIEELQKRLEELLHERDDINIRLCSLYREEDTSGKKIRRRSYRANLAAARMRAARSAYRRCASSAREVARFRVSLQEKSKAYEAMNKKIEYSAYLAECRYRMSHERPRGAQRRKLNAEIRDTQKRIRDMDADIRFHTDKLGRRSAKSPKPEGQLTWLILLILLGVVGFAIYWFRAPIWEFLQPIISGLLNKGA